MATSGAARESITSSTGAFDFLKAGLGLPRPLCVGWTGSELDSRRNVERHSGSLSDGRVRREMAESERGDVEKRSEENMGCIASLGGVEPPELPTAEIAAFLQEKGKEGPEAVNKKTEEFKEELGKLDDGASLEVKEAKMKLAKNSEEKQVKIAAIKSYCEGVFRDQLKDES